MNKRDTFIISIIGLAILAFGVVWFRGRDHYVEITEAMLFSVGNNVITFYGKPVSYGGAISYEKANAEWAATLRSTTSTQVTVTVRQHWRDERIIDVKILEVNNLPPAAR